MGFEMIVHCIIKMVNETKIGTGRSIAIKEKDWNKLNVLEQRYIYEMMNRYNMTMNCTNGSISLNYDKYI